MHRHIGQMVLLLILLVACQSVSNREGPKPASHFAANSQPAQHTQAFGNHFAVSTQGIASSRAAQQMWRQGGNIIDAAVAASFAISVERPESTGLGGGGFLLFHQAESHRTYAIDFRERAPEKATGSMFLDAQKNPDPSKSREGILAVGVPGLVAGLLEIHAKFGSLPLEKILAPAIEIAENGFIVTPHLHEALKQRAEVLRKDPAARAIFLDANGEPWATGRLVIQKDLGQTLRQIVKLGRSGFYEGDVAKSLFRFSKKHGGLLTPADLKNYHVAWREPVKGEFHGFEIQSMPPPSSGGVHVIQFLQFLENDRLREAGFLSAKSLHLAASSLQSAFADRAQYLGDPDFVKVPTRGLTDKNYSLKRREQVALDKARTADEVSPGQPSFSESSDTTHLSLMDAQGNAVSTTQTINGYMGAGLVVPGTGILLNNEMDDFSAKVGASNMFGAIGSEANAVAPRKTPLSSMAPTLLLRDGLAVLVVGAPGGTRIISCVAQTILNVVEFHLPLLESVSSIRYHQQWRPDVLEIEPPGPTPEVQAQLEKMGYKVKIKPIGCEVMAIEREGLLLDAVSDPRDWGTAVAE